MPLQEKSGFGDDDRIARIKDLSGWCIDARRRYDKVSQKKLAERAGITARWLREIEGGNPSATLDDHFRCASAVGLSATYMLIPILFDEHRRDFPREWLIHDLRALEVRCIDAISGSPLAVLA